MGEKVGEGLLLKESFLKDTANNSETEEKKYLEFISSGNMEIDRRLEGGIPTGSLCLLEGANNSGKSIFMNKSH